MNEEVARVPEGRHGGRSLLQVEFLQLITE
jgi:hypothetical protein